MCYELARIGIGVLVRVFLDSTCEWNRGFTLAASGGFRLSFLSIDSV